MRRRTVIGGSHLPAAGSSILSAKTRLSRRGSCHRNRRTSSAMEDTCDPETVQRCRHGKPETVSPQANRIIVVTATSMLRSLSAGSWETELERPYATATKPGGS